MFRHGVGLADLLLLVSVVGLFTTTSKTLELSYRYDTAYACEGKTLKIECRDGELIKLIRANYGRFSITICNDHGNTEWSVNCMSPKSLRVLLSSCGRRQNCSVPISNDLFGIDPCPGTPKYIEVNYKCISEDASTTTTTSRPSPPWLVTSQPPMWSTVKTSSRPGGGGDIPVAVIPAGGGAPPPPPVQQQQAPKQAPNGNNSKANVSTSTTVSAVADSSSSRGPAAGTTDSTSVHSLGGGGVSSIPVRVGVGGGPVEDGTGPVAPIDHPVTGGEEDGEGDADDGMAGHAAAGMTTIRPRKYHAYGDHNADDANLRPHPAVTSTATTSLTASNSPDDYCTPTTQRNIYWNWTRAGQINIQSCPGGTTGFARWRCVRPAPAPDTAGSGGPSVWSPPTPDLSECRSVWLTSLEQRVLLGKDPLISITSDLAQVTSSKTLYGGDMMITTKIIQKMAQKMNVDIQTFPDPRQREAIVTEMLSDVVRTGSNLLDSTQHLSWRDLSHKEQMRVATSLLIGLEENAFLLADTVMRVKTVDQMVKNIMLSVRVLDARSVSTEVFPTPGDGRWSTSNDTIELPPDALLENSDGGLVRLVFVAFDRLEEILHWHPDGNAAATAAASAAAAALNGGSSAAALVPQTAHGGPGHLAPDAGGNAGGSVTDAPAAVANLSRVLNSKVISASLGKGRHIQLRESVRLTLRHLYTENVSNPTCVFWDYTTSAWSEEGCHVESTNRTHTVCLCNHLTNFAILMDVHAVYLPPGHQMALQIITYVGCSISIICLVLAIITFHLVRGLKSDRTTIHSNLSVCLLIAELTFIAFIDRTENRIFCSAVAAFLQYFFLCAFMWMFFEGFQLYVMLIEVFEAEKSRIRWYYVLAYVIPALIVGIAYAVYPEGYGSQLHCWLRHDNYFIFTFIVPVVIVIMLNIVFLTMAIVTMCRHTNSTISMKNKEHSRLASARVWLRGAFVLMFLLGITWTFGLLYINRETVAMAYIFSIANSLQGFSIFFFHCVQNDKARKEYRRFIRRHGWLPACLRCSKPGGGAGGTGGTSGSGTTGTGSAGSAAATGVGGTGTNTAQHVHHVHHHPQQQQQHTPTLPQGGGGGGSSSSGSNSTSTGLSKDGHSRPALYGCGGVDRVNGSPALVGHRSPTMNVPGAAGIPSATCYGGNDPHQPEHPHQSDREGAPSSHTAHHGLVLNNAHDMLGNTAARRHHQHYTNQQNQYLSDAIANQLHQLHAHAHAHTPAVMMDYGHHKHLGIGGGEGGGGGGRKGRGATSPYHTYSEIQEARLMHQQQQQQQQQYHHHRGMDIGQSQQSQAHYRRDEEDDDDPVYEEIERAAAAAAAAGSGVRAHANLDDDEDDEDDDDDDEEDDDTQRQSASDMSRQSSRSYGDHRPLIPAYSPHGQNNGALHPQQMMLHHYYHPGAGRVAVASTAGGGGGGGGDTMRSLAAVLDGQTVVCHLEPAEQQYTPGGGRAPPVPPESAAAPANAARAIMLQSSYCAATGQDS